MRNLLTVFICGTVSAIGWALLTAVTNGAPDQTVSILDSLTFGQFPDEIDAAGNGFFPGLDNGKMPTRTYLALHFLLFVLAMVPTISIINGRISKHPKSALAIVLTFGVLFRIILIPSTPIHENDYHRYLWDGKSMAAGVNPYLFSPQEVTAEADPVGALFSFPGDPINPPRDLTLPQRQVLDKLVELRQENRELHAGIGHPRIPTIYPPAAQAVFYLSDSSMGGALGGWKTTVVLFDIATCLLLAYLLASVGKTPCLVIIYAWCPLVLKEFANSAHYDAIPIFFALVAVGFAIKLRKSLAAAFLALGTLAKFFPAVLLPALIRPAAKMRCWLNYMLFLGIVLLGFIPFLLWQDAGLTNTFAGLRTYSEDWQFFSGAFALVHRVTTVIAPETTYLVTKAIVASLFVAAAIWIYFRGAHNQEPNDILQNCFLVSAVLFLCNPCAFPWYFAWVAPFLCFYPRAEWLALSALLPLTYLSFQPAETTPVAHTFLFGIPILSWIIWGSFAAVLVARISLRKLQTSGIKNR